MTLTAFFPQDLEARVPEGQHLFENLLRLGPARETDELEDLRYRWMLYKSKLKDASCLLVGAKDIRVPGLRDGMMAEPKLTWETQAGPPQQQAEVTAQRQGDSWVRYLTCKLSPSHPATLRGWSSSHDSGDHCSKHWRSALLPAQPSRQPSASAGVALSAVPGRGAATPRGRTRPRPQSESAAEPALKHSPLLEAQSRDLAHLRH